MPRVRNESARMLTPDQAAKYLGLGKEFVQNKMFLNEIPSIDPHGNERDIRTTEEWCDEWLELQRKKRAAKFQQREAERYNG